MEESTETIPIPVPNSRKKTIPVICPWCNKLVRVAKWEVKDGRKTAPTHGICNECYKKIRK